MLMSLQHQDIHHGGNGLLETGADPGRNLTRAQQEARGCGYMCVENISEL